MAFCSQSNPSQIIGIKSPTLPLPLSHDPLTSSMLQKPSNTLSTPAASSAAGGLPPPSDDSSSTNKIHPTYHPCSPPHPEPTTQTCTASFRHLFLRATFPSWMHSCLMTSSIRWDGSPSTMLLLRRTRRDFGSSAMTARGRFFPDARRRSQLLMLWCGEGGRRELALSAAQGRQAGDTLNSGMYGEGGRLIWRRSWGTGMCIIRWS